MQDFDRLNRIAKRLQERYPRGTRIMLLSNISPDLVHTERLNQIGISAVYLPCEL